MARTDFRSDEERTKYVSDYVSQAIDKATGK
jgi:hypothetical protein